VSVPNPSAESTIDLSIRRASTAEHVADALREAIVERKLKPGTPLREGAIAGSVGVSRNTVREAFRLLAREGIVKHNLHRGVVVTRLSEEDVADIYAVRRVIEGAAVGTRRGLTEEDVAALDEPVRALERARRGRDWRRIVDNDLRFHRRLVRLHRSPRLEQLHAAVLTELRLAASIFDRLYEDAGHVDDHREIYELLVRGEHGRCRKLLDRHLVDAEGLLRRIVREDGD
jgi:DNA-binding GntR family transcriptional regulator